MRPRFNSPLLTVLKNRNFRLLWYNGAISNTGELSELLVMGWLVLQLTGSPWQVALVGLSRTVSLFAFTLIAGAMGDQKDRRHIILASNATNIMVAAAVLLVLTMGDVQPWHLFLAAAVRGATRSFENTSRRALVFHIVGPASLVQAISLEHIGMSTGRILGPIAIGTLLQVTGTAVSSYSLLTGLYSIAFISVVLLKVAPTLSSLPRRPVLRSVGEGLKYAYSTPSIAGVLTASVVMNAMFQYHLFIPVVAQEHLGVGPGLMGLLAAADGMGFVFGALFIGLLGNKIRFHGRVFLAGCIGVTVFLLAFALSPWYILSFFLLVSLGTFQVGFSTMQSSILLMASPPNFHSRIFGAQGLAVGTGQFGNMEMGALASAFSITVALAANALVGMGLLLLIAIFMPALRRPIERVEEPIEDTPQPLVEGQETTTEDQRPKPEGSV
ncbi:MAG: MFS transporter [Dehalococcoidia bacterium]|nr:MFS transporter [Chloroflexota bacterium]